MARETKLRYVGKIEGTNQGFTVEDKSHPSRLKEENTNVSRLQTTKNKTIICNMKANSNRINCRTWYSRHALTSLNNAFPADRPV